MIFGRFLNKDNKSEICSVIKLYDNTLTGRNTTLGKN